MQKSAVRWVPAIAVPAIILAGAVIIPATASASVRLPEKTVQQVLQMVVDSHGTSFSGTVDRTSDLGLPDLGSLGGSGTDGSRASDILEMITGSHTAEVFQSGTDSSRVQVIENLAERDVFRSGQDVWAWDSEKNEAVHTVLPPSDETSTSPVTPGDMIASVLSEVGETTDVTLTDNVSVAGRSAYSVILTPKAADTLVGDVTLSVDGETGVPLSFVVTAVGQDAPAVSVAFSSIDFAEPAADVFVFTPPAGATVTEVDPQDDPQHDGAGVPSGDHPEPTVTGEGWSRVISVPVPAEVTGSAPELDQLLTPVDGGRALQTTLVSALLTDDGRLLIGAVSVADLQAAVAP